MNTHRGRGHETLAVEFYESKEPEENWKPACMHMSVGLTCMTRYQLPQNECTTLNKYSRMKAQRYQAQKLALKWGNCSGHGTRKRGQKTNVRLWTHSASDSRPRRIRYSGDHNVSWPQGKFPNKQTLVMGQIGRKIAAGTAGPAR